MKRQIVSRHMLRRRARARMRRLEGAQSRVRTFQSDVADSALLKAARIRASDTLHLQKASRGPWRWYVVAS